jgi:hypothetical protein
MKITLLKKDVHTEHCCIRHGCKYGYVKGAFNACTVIDGRKPQSFPCETCQWELDEGGLELAYLMNEMYDKGFTAGNDKGFESGQAGCQMSH